MAALSLYEICHRILKAYRERNTEELTRAVEDLAWFYPTDGTPSVIKPFAHTEPFAPWPSSTS